MKRFNKEIKLNKISSFLIKLGTTNKMNPIVFYINGSTWVKPLDDENFSDKINNIIYNFKKNILNSFLSNDKISNKFILNFDTKTNAMQKGKKTFVTFELYLRQKNNINSLKDIMEINENINPNIISLIDSLKNHFIQNNFEFI